MGRDWPEASMESGKRGERGRRRFQLGTGATSSINAGPGVTSLTVARFLTITCVSMTYRLILTLSTAAHNLIETRGKMPDVGRVESSHRYPPIVCQVNMHLLHQCPALLRADPRETAGCDQRPYTPTHPVHAPEHADLSDDVVPVARRLEFFSQQPVQLLPHRNDSACHHRYVSFPLFIQYIIGQN